MLLCCSSLSVAQGASMIVNVIRFTLSLACLSSSVVCITVLQSPPELVLHRGEAVTLTCSHDDKNFDKLYWYKQTDGAGLELQGYLSFKQPYTEVGSFNVSGDGEKEGFLKSSAVTAEESGVYFCAVRDSSYSEAYFGSGTKLTVLESGIEVTRPKVKVLPPSNREGCKKTNRTLVCVATGFYPDHITVSWKLNGVEVTSGVRTDDTALRDEDNKFYSITSRLRVSYRKWFDTRSTFTCLTRFYNGSGYPEDADSINGVNGGGMDREYLLKSGLTAKLSYSVFIAKSFLYGLFVSAVVWKIRSSAAKRYE